MTFSSGDTHSDKCFQPEKRACPVSGGQHRWSGWPGAWCQDCGDEDKDELCIGYGCSCPCHSEFWAELGGYDPEVEPTIPNPGSDEALDQGCSCAVLDNAHGRGYFGGPPGTFVYNLDCTVHCLDGEIIGVQEQKNIRGDSG